MPGTPSLPMRYVLMALTWLALAVAAAASGTFATVPFPIPQLILAALTAAVIQAAFKDGPLGDWLAAVDVRWLVGIHLVRLAAGTAFVVLAIRGTLAPGFGFPAGYGDIAVAILAAALLLTGPAANPGRRRLYFLWNCAGLIDLVFVVLSAGRVGRADPAGMLPLLQLPLSLLPTFVVPILLASHLVIFARLREA